MNGGLVCRISQAGPFFSPQVNVVSVVPFLVRDDFGKHYRAQRAYFAAGLLSFRAAFFFPVRRIGAQVAFL